MDLQKFYEIKILKILKYYLPPFIGGNPRPNTAPISPSV
jgi:hypothetical protein